MQENQIIPEFLMYEDDLEASEIEELESRLSSQSRSNKDRFRLFTDILLEYVGSGEWKNRSAGFLGMLAKASFLRGMYGYNQILAKGCDSLTCKGYAAAAYCRQSLDPRWLNNLRNYVNHSWQAKDYVTFAELSGQLASVLIDLGYSDRAKEVAEESIDKVTKLTSKNERIRAKVQAALLRPRIILAYIAQISESREESLMRLNSAEDTARHLDDRLAMADIDYYRARALEEACEFEEALGLIKSVLRKYERMGYLHGVTEARNLWGIIHLDLGQLLEARDQFEELLVIQQQLNNQIGLAKTLINVGEIDRELGQLDQMETYNKRALEISQEAEFMRGIAVAKANLGDVELRRGNFEIAIELYEEVIALAKSSGMKNLLDKILFSSADLRYMIQDYSAAIYRYSEAKEIAVETHNSLLSFLADVSDLVTRWAMREEPNPELFSMIVRILGGFDIWNDPPDSSNMREVRQRVFDDSSIQSEVCIFFQNEMNFECRVERKTLKKECYGTLFWNGSLCPYFSDFIEKLRE